MPVITNFSVVQMPLIHDRQMHPKTPQHTGGAVREIREHTSLRDISLFI